jgi:hypothetical protein
MKSFILILSLGSILVGCDALKALDSAANKMPNTMTSMNNKMDETNKGIQSTNESVRLQKLILAKDDMLKEENTRDLEPVALGMIAGAKKFGEAATTEELIEFTYILLKQIRDQKPEDMNNVELKKQYDHDKMIKFSQLLTIAGFAPEEKVDQIIDEQIYGSGLYIDEGYAFLMARVYFLGTYLNESLLAMPIKSIKKMDETILRLGSMDKILKLPFKSDVKMDVVGFFIRENISVALYDESGDFLMDTWNAPKLWKKVNKAFDRDLKDGNLISASEAKKQAVASKIAAMKATVQNFIESWNK